MSKPVRDGGLSPLGISLAVLAHIVLLAVLYVGTSWNATPPTPVEAMLWSELPGKDNEATKPLPAKVAPPKAVKQATEAPVPPEKVQPSPTKPALPAKPVEAPVLAKNDKAAIKFEAPASKPKKEVPKKVEPTPVTPDKPVKQLTKAEPKKADAKPQKDAFADQLAAEEAEMAKERAAQKAAADAKAKADAQAKAKQGRDTADYQQKVASLVRSRVVFDDPGGANLEAQFLVPLLPTYEILEDGIQLLKSSGNKSYDEAVARALHALKRFPPPPEGVPLGRESKFSFRLR